MTDTAKPVTGAFPIANISRERLMRAYDWIGVALVASLPWSTSATGILVGLWLLLLIPTLDFAGVRREVLTPAGGLPVLLWALGVLGMLWADVSLSERLAGLGSFHKLLVIPLLIFHFRRSGMGARAMYGFLISCGVLLAYSWLIMFAPDLPGGHRVSPGVPVKDYISQSAMFTMGIAIALELAIRAWRNARGDIAAAFVALAVAFLCNILFIATSRTALVVVPIIVLLFGFKRLDWRGLVALIVALIIAAAMAWQFSSYLRSRTGTFVKEVETYFSDNASTSAGERLEFWIKSVKFIREAPIIGHGTGTIREQFRRVATGETGASALIASNPHNQTLAVAIQLGLVGTVVLFAMWLAHLMLFRGGGIAAWVGLAVVVQNIVGSLFNSHLFDFTHGWLYVIGVGIAGGIVAHQSCEKAAVS